MSRMRTDPSAGRGGIRPPALWDPVVRLTHWGVALSVLANAVLTGGGSVIHVWIGWIAMTLLLLRLIWGIAGPTEARFSAFPPSVSGAVAHIRALGRGRAPLHRSHNPAGALMVYAFWGMVAIMCVTGLMMTWTTPFGVMALKAAVASGDWGYAAAHPLPWGEDVVEVVEEIHEVVSNLLLLMAALHVGGVVVESRLMKTNLLRPMLFGNRTRP